MPFTGTVSLDCSLWDAVTIGKQVGATVNLPGVNVTNGLCSVVLNGGEEFGATAFNGAPRWLAISVNGTPLSLRQELTAVAYAARPLSAPNGHALDASDGSPTNELFVDNAGNVGINTTAPASPFALHASGNGFMHTDGTQSRATYIGGGGWLGTLSAHPLHQFTANGPARLTVDTGGYVGIGASAPQAKLHIGGTPGVDGLMFPDGTLQTSATSGAAGFWSASGTNIFSNNTRMVGVGTGTPNAKLHLGGGSTWTSYAWGKSLAINNADAIELGYGAGSTRFGIGSSSNNLYLFHTATEGTADIAHYFMSADSAGRIAMGDLVGSLTAKLSIFASGDGAELLRLNTEFEITALGGTNVATFFADDSFPQVGIGTTTPVTTLDVNGTTRTKVLQITGADVAEKFPTNGEKVEPGTVMEIDPENAGLLRVSRDPYDPRVAGIVNGANDYPAGAILGYLPGNEDAPPIALSGRVYVQCDATDVDIKPGDLLTTSATPGHAMKAVDRERSHGAILGKAMTALPKGQRGLVLVLVSLQ